jgi:hypothetical protein
MKTSKEKTGDGGCSREVWWGQGDPVILLYRINSLIVVTIAKVENFNHWSSVRDS